MSFYTSSGASYGGSNRHTGSRAAPSSHGRAAEDADNKALLFSGLGGVVAAIPSPTSVSKPTSGSLVTGFHALASYSWLDAPQPSIVVPSEAYAPLMIRGKLSGSLSRRSPGLETAKPPIYAASRHRKTIC